MSIHYNDNYFSWQKKAGEYGANQDLWLYQPFINKNDTVLDFGCGGGYMLERVQCNKKYGVDINPIARKEAKKKGLQVFTSLDEIPQNLKFDRIMSHHALEHVENPALILKALKKKLKKDGKLVVVVPIDDWRQQKNHAMKDVNNHLYTWTPLLLGNLFRHCGYSVEKVEVVEHAWLPLSRLYYKYVPKIMYRQFTKVWSAVSRYRLIRIVASN